jgi:hypothetical protein
VVSAKIGKHLINIFNSPILCATIFACLGGGHT